MAFLPAIEPVLRKLFDVGIPGTSGYVENLNRWVAYLGVMVATREKRHLSLSTGMVKLPPLMGRVAKGFVDFLSTAVAAGLFWASLEFIRAEMGVAVQIGGWLPASLAEAILPIAFGVTVLRFGFQAGHGWDRVIALLGIPAAAAIGFLLAPHADDLLWPGIALLGAAALLGAPYLCRTRRCCTLAFLRRGRARCRHSGRDLSRRRVALASDHPAFHARWLSLAEGGASQRLVRLFRAWFAWLPGGAAIATTLVCAFFSTFTGASGVTILALGGLLLPVLIKSGYSERFAVGLVTSTGSIGLLLPPSLAVILYGVVAHISIPELFKAAVGPGLLMIGSVCAYSVYKGFQMSAARSSFDLREALAALWDAKWEMLVPLVALFGIFGGFSTLTEAAAITVVYVIFAESIVHRELRLMRDFPKVLVKSATLIGGVFVILGVAMGLTNYLIDADVPVHAAAWAKYHIESRIVFLLVSNLFLLIVGCLDGFSAIIIAVPLVQPISAAFGIHPAAPRDHLSGQPRACLSYAAARHEPLSRLLSLRATAREHLPKCCSICRRPARSPASRDVLARTRDRQLATLERESVRRLVRRIVLGSRAAAASTAITEGVMVPSFVQSRYRKFKHIQLCRVMARPRGGRSHTFLLD